LSSATSLTLLNTIQGASDPGSWQRFCEIYYPLVCQWCQTALKGNEDFLDVAQDVFLEIHQKIKTFKSTGKGTFRQWLKTIIQTNIFEYNKKKFPMLVSYIELDREVSACFGRDWDEKYVSEVFSKACKYISVEFESNSWTAFVKTHFEGADPDLVAKELGTTANAIYIARYRILKRLKEYVEEIIS
jgi:RNA polymerase sigma factor (sigma-70 family)